MKRIIFEIENVTPMFMGGAEQNQPPEFRTQSIKGLLRFWNRALFPNSLEEEDRLFGSTEWKSPFKLKAQELSPKMGLKGEGRWKEHKTTYLLGLGLAHYNKGVLRPFYEPGSSFRLEFLFRAGLRPKDERRILLAFWALVNLGGLGSRCRRGLGSIRVVSAETEGVDVGKMPLFGQ